MIIAQALVVLVSAGASAADIDIAHEQLALESALHRQLKEDVEAILPAEQFAISVAVGIDVETKRELAHAENTVRRAERRRVLREDLPGLEPLSQPVEEGGSLAHQVFRTVSVPHVRRVQVNLTIDEGAEKAAADLAEHLVRQQLRARFGGRARVDVSRLRLPEQKAPAATVVPDKASSWQPSWWWVVASAGFATLLFLFWWLLRLVQRRRLPYLEAKPLPPASLPDSGPPPLPYAHNKALPEPGAPSAELESEKLRHTVSALIRELVAEPLLTRRFVANLSPASWRSFMACFETRSMRRALADLAGHSRQTLDEDAQSAPPLNGDRIGVLSRLHEELAEYRQVASVALHQRFGFLRFLDRSEVHRLIAPLKPTQIAAVLQHCEPDQARELVEGFDRRSRRRILDALLGESGAPPPELTALEAQLRQRVEEIGRHILMPFTDRHAVVGLMLEDSEEQQKELEQILAERPQLQAQYGHYLLGFDDFLQAAPQHQARVLDELTNEEIALVALDLKSQKRQTLLDLLAPERREVIASLAHIHQKADPSRISTSRRRLLRCHRQLCARGHWHSES